MTRLLVLILGLFCGGGAECQTLNDGVRTSEFSMEVLGYGAYEVLEITDEFILARVGDKGRSGGQLFTYVAIHDVPMDAELLKFDGTWLQMDIVETNIYSGMLTDQIFKSSVVKDKITFKNGPVSYRGMIELSHYSTSYRSPKRTRLTDKNFEEPLYKSYVRSQSSDSYQPTLDLKGNQPFSGPLNTLVDFCVRDVVEYENPPLSEVSRKCSNKLDLSHPLADYGFSKSRLLTKSGDAEIYLADGRRDKSHSDEKDKVAFDKDVLVVVRDIRTDQSYIDDGYLSLLSTLGQTTQLSVHSKPKIRLYQYAKGFDYPDTPNSPEYYRHLQRPLIEPVVVHWQPGQGVLVDHWSSKQLLNSSTSLDKIENTLKENTERKRKHEIAAATKISEDEARTALAQRYGYLYFDDEYFADHEAWYFNQTTSPLGKSALQTYLNGEFSSKVPHVNYVDFRAILLKYVELSSEKCSSTLPRGSHPISINTISTTMQNGVPISEPKIVASKMILVHPDLSELYEQIFEVEHNGLGKAQSTISAWYMLTDMYVGRRSLQSSAARIHEPLRSVEWLFSKEGCNSTALTQLRSNLRRAGAGLPSVAASRVSADERKITQDYSNTKLLFERFESGLARVYYTFVEPTPGWSPSISELLAKASRDYGSTQHHHSFGKTETLVTVEVEWPAANALQKLQVVRPGMSPPGSRLLMEINSSLFSVGNPDSLLQNKDAQIRVDRHVRALRRNNPEALLVHCEYEGKQDYLFWYRQKPPSSNDEELRSLSADHPYIGLKGPLDRCPATYPN